MRIYATFSDAEQVAIKRIWQRVAEDYAPFDIDVTTERPATFTTRTAQALDHAQHRRQWRIRTRLPRRAAWPTSMCFAIQQLRNLPAGVDLLTTTCGNDESYIAEAASHEIGHNLGPQPRRPDGWHRVLRRPRQRRHFLGTAHGHRLQPQRQPVVQGRVLPGQQHPGRPRHHCRQDSPTAPTTTATRRGTATPLVITGGTNIVSTTPETDPANTNSANKGVLERNTDVDVFSFITGNGPISLAVNPWIMPSGTTRGGNLDLLVELRDSSGNLLLTNNPVSQTTALIQTNLTEGVYYLHVRNVGAGAPASSTPTGYTAYGSIGQYFISGYLVPSGFIVPPLAEAQIPDLTQTGVGAKSFTVTYSDNVGHRGRHGRTVSTSASPARMATTAPANLFPWIIRSTGHPASPPTPQPHPTTALGPQPTTALTAFGCRPTRSVTSKAHQSLRVYSANSAFRFPCPFTARTWTQIPTGL